METKRLPEGIRRIPYGISNFYDLITKNYVYVDKTRYIELLEWESNPYQLFIRPRKFGKSRLTTMLNYYYDPIHADKAGEVFKDLYIGSHPTDDRGKLAVLNFDFSGIDTGSEEGFITSFSGKIQSKLAHFLVAHRDYPRAEDILKEVLYAPATPSLLTKVFRFAEDIHIGLYVVIDEYDHFANDLIAMGTRIGNDVYKRMVSANGTVRDFYETLKDGTKTVVKRIFMTGISPVLLNDLTSGFNIADNITLKSQYNEMLGFTLEEVDFVARSVGIEPDSIDIDIAKYYNGYCFCKNGKCSVYNPAMVLSYFKQLFDDPDERQIVDPNLRTDYTRLKLLVQDENNRKRLLRIIKNNGIDSNIIQQFSIDNLQSDEYFVSLLFYMGLLTVDKDKSAFGLHLKIPNYAIQTIYWELVWNLTMERKLPSAILHLRENHRGSV
jgi:hypothetical protein